MLTLTGKPKQVFTSITFDPSGTRLFAGDHAGEIDVWELPSTTPRICLAKSRPRRQVHQLAITADGGFVYAACGRSGLRVVNLADGQVETLTFDWESVQAVAASPGGERIIVGGETMIASLNGEGVARSYAICAGGRMTQEWEVRRPRACTLVAVFFPDGRRICLEETWLEYIDVLP